MSLTYYKNRFNVCLLNLFSYGMEHEKCFCCFAGIVAKEDGTAATAEDRQWFFEIIRLEFKSTARDLICLPCRRDLQYCMDFRNRVIESRSNAESLKREVSGDEAIEFVDIKIENTNEAISVESVKRKTIRPGKTRKQCPTCGIFVLNLPEHIKMVHQSCKRFSCDFCSYSCYFKTKITRHLQRHIPKHLRKQFPCGIADCNFSASRKDALRSHQMAMHQASRGKVCLCVECGKKFFNKSQLNIHYKAVHEKVKNHLCNLCGKSFFNVNDMEMHVKRHGVKDEACDVCGNLFYCSLDLRRHMKIHSDPTIPCDVKECSKKFYTNSKMRTHVKIRHEGAKDFFCDYCRFSQHNNLKRHVNSVHKSLRINCLIPGCSYSVARKDKYKNHLTSQHKFLDENARETILKSVKFE